MGYHQIKSEPTMFIMLSYSGMIPRAYTIISLWSDQCYHLVHINCGIPSSWISRWPVVEPINIVYLDHDSCWTFKLVLETSQAWPSCSVHEVYVGWEERLSLIHVHLVQVAVVSSRKFVLLPVESSQVSHAYVRSILWFGDLQPSLYRCP